MIFCCFWKKHTAFENEETPFPCPRTTLSTNQLIVTNLFLHLVNRLLLFCQVHSTCSPLKPSNPSWSERSIPSWAGLYSNVLFFIFILPLWPLLKSKFIITEHYCCTSNSKEKHHQAISFHVTYYQTIKDTGLIKHVSSVCEDMPPGWPANLVS